MIRADNAVVRFWIFALGQFFIWIVVPSIVFRNLPLDVVEGLGWGHGWPSGTYKHPPLQAWILELAAIIGGRHDSAIYAAGAGSLLLTYWALWRFGRMVVAPPVALVGVMALASCFYFATTIPEFNPNVVQMPLYVLCGWLFWRGVQNDRLYDWLLFGFCAGLGMLGKYSFAFMLLSIGGFILIDAKARAALRRPGPYLALIVGVAVFAPHFAWMVQHNWLPLHYAQSRTHYADGIVMALAQAAKFFLGQMLAIFPVLLVLWLARTRSGSGVQLAKDASLRRYLTFLAWGPVALIVLLSAVTGAQMRDMWGMGLWVFIGLWAAERWRSDWDRSALARGVLLLAMLAMPVAVWLGASHSVSFGFRPWRTEFPGRRGNGRLGATPGANHGDKNRHAALRQQTNPRAAGGCGAEGSVEFL